MKPKFFATPDAFRIWLAEHHEDAPELAVGFYKKGSGKPSIAWPEAVDVALCFGWIDGVRHSIDDVSYRIRFTPRKPRSTWSRVNINRVDELTRAGLMHPAGQKAFEQRRDATSGIYAYEQREAAALDRGAERQFRGNKDAWRFFESRHRRTGRRPCGGWSARNEKRPARNASPR